MSKPRFIWWSYIKSIIKHYPAMKEEFDAVEDCPICDLPTTRQREFESIRRAVSMIRSAPQTGAIRMKLIELTFWNKTHNLYEAAEAVGIPYNVARQYQAEFIYLVAKHYGLLDE